MKYLSLRSLDNLVKSYSFGHCFYTLPHSLPSGVCPSLCLSIQTLFLDNSNCQSLIELLHFLTNFWTLTLFPDNSCTFPRILLQLDRKVVQRIFGGDSMPKFDRDTVLCLLMIFGTLTLFLANFYSFHPVRLKHFDC